MTREKFVRQWFGGAEPTFEEFVRLAKKLRQEADDAEYRYLEFLVEFEEHGRSAWSGAGYGDYPETLEKVNLCRPTRYTRFKRVVKGLGLEAMQDVSAEAVIAAGTFAEPALQQEVIDESRKFEKCNGTAISEQSAGRIVGEVKARTAGLRTGHKSYSEVVALLERRDARIAELEQEVAALRAENKKLKRGKVRTAKAAA